MSNKIKVNGITVDTTKKYSLPYQKTKKRFKGNNAKNTFDLETFEAASYQWWKYVIKVRGKVVFNDFSYSSTTNGHQSTMRQLLKELGIKVHLFVNISQSLSQESFRVHVLESFYTSLALAEAKLANPFIRDNTRADLRDTIKELKGKIKVARSLGAQCSKSRIARIREDVRESEAKRVAERRAEAKAQREANKLIRKQSDAVLKTGEEFQLSA